MSNLPLRLKELRRRKNFTQTSLGDMLGVGKTTVSNYETGYSTPDSETLLKLAELFDVSVDYLLGRTQQSREDARVQYKNYRRIPIYSKVGSEEPFFFSQNIVDYYDLPEEEANSGEFFGVKMSGECMNRARISDGDSLIVRKQEIAENGEIVVAVILGEEAVVRRYYQAGRYVTLVPDSTNSFFEPQVYDVAKVELRLLGKVERAIIKF